MPLPHPKTKRVLASNASEDYRTTILHTKFFAFYTHRLLLGAPHLYELGGNLRAVAHLY